VICFDASLAAKWYWFEEEAERARALLAASLRQEEEIIEPHLLLSEIANIVRRRMHRRMMVLVEARDVLAQVIGLPMHFESPPNLHDLALALAERFELPAVYDAHYLALCEITGATFWTADERLYRAVAGELPFVRRLADYQPD
jgi:predicted nucleic acid-binding protein